MQEVMHEIMHRLPFNTFMIFAVTYGKQEIKGNIYI